MSVLIVPWAENSPLLETGDADAVFLPGSIPAALALQKRKVTVLRTSQFIGDKDFHEVWEQTFRAAWRVVEEAAADSDGDEPRLMPLFAYSIVLVLAQLLVLKRVLDRIHERYVIDEVRVEGALSSPESDFIFGSGLGNPVYGDAVLIWATDKKIPARRFEAQGANSVLPMAVRSSRTGFEGMVRTGVIRLIHALKELKRSSVAFQIAKILWALIRGRSTIVFTNRPQRLPPLAGAIQSNIAIVEWGGSLPWRGQPSARRAYERMTGSKEWGELAELSRPFASYLESKIQERLRKIWPSGIAMYRYASWLVRLVQHARARPVFLADGPYRDILPAIGFAAEAFRRHGGTVAEFQHGGNYTVIARGFVPLILTTGLADLFLEWNDAGCREHEIYGLKTQRLKYATVGCWSSPSAIPTTFKSPQISGERLRIVFAPTLLSTTTICGVNFVWDDYSVLLDEVLTMLDRAEMHVDVSIVPHEEMRYFLSRRRYHNLKFHFSAFRRLSEEADVIIAESLFGSPVYETMTTDKPAIVLTGNGQCEIASRFLQDLRRRCVTYDTVESYLAGLRDFIRDPRSFLATHVREIDPDVTRSYFTPTDAGRFWQAFESLGHHTTHTSVAEGRVGSNLQ